MGRNIERDVREGPNRRDFLKLAGGAGVAFAFGACSRKEDFRCSLPRDHSRYENPPNLNELFSLKEYNPDQSLPTIVLVVNDSWRYDTFSLEATPNLVDLAKQGTVYTHYFVNAGQTHSSTASYFSGRLPIFDKNHPSDFVTGFEFMVSQGDSPPRNGEGRNKIPSQLLTFPEILKLNREYITLLANNNINVSYWRGYGKKQWDISIDVISRGGNTVIDPAIYHLKEIRRAGIFNPLFMYIHLMDTHYPYDESHLDFGEREIQEAFFNSNSDILFRNEHLPLIKKKYLDGARFADSQIYKMIKSVQKIEKATSGRKVILIATADHGDMHGEYIEPWGVGHPGRVTEEVIHVPMIICGEEIKSGTNTALHCGTELAATVLRLTNHRVPLIMDQMDLIRGEGKQSIVARSVFDSSLVTLSNLGFNLRNIPH